MVKPCTQRDATVQEMNAECSTLFSSRCKVLNHSADRYGAFCLSHMAAVLIATTWWCVRVSVQYMYEIRPSGYCTCVCLHARFMCTHVLVNYKCPHSSSFGPSNLSLIVWLFRSTRRSAEVINMGRKCGRGHSNMNVWKSKHSTAQFQWVFLTFP